MNLQGRSAALVSPLGGTTRSEEQQKLRAQQFKEVKMRKTCLSMQCLESIGLFDPSIDPYETTEVGVEDVKKGKLSAKKLPPMPSQCFLLLVL